jgi:predicted RecA/RadA family phage recombinase
MADSFSYTGRRLPIAVASGAIASGALVVQEGLFGVALGAIASGASGTLAAEGVWDLPVTATKGQRVYIHALTDSVAATLTTESSDAYFVGVAVAATADGKAPVLLGPQSPRRQAFVPVALLWDPAGPTGVAEGASLTDAKVSIIDANGDVCTSSTAVVTVALKVPGGATLGGDVHKAAVAGEATFTDLTVDIHGTYILTATSPDLTSDDSAEFTITNP